MPIPDSLTSTTRDGETITLNRTQLTRANTIVGVADTVGGLGDKGKRCALMTSLVESTLRILSNVAAYPESADYPNDGDGSDHDSLGLFQQRPESGWGTVAEIMDANYSARAFYGGPSGPNYPSPAGVLDIPGWETMDNGELCQAVQVSAFPDRYSNYEPVAIDIISALGGGTPGGGDELANLRYIKKLGNQLQVIDALGNSRLAVPVGATMWWLGTQGGGPGPGVGAFMWPFDPSTVSDEYGPRTGGVGTFHEGIDFGVGCDTPIPVIANGTGSENYYHTNFGNLLIVDHGVLDHGTYNGKQARSLYAHQSHPSPIAVGTAVTKGQIIGNVGDTGASFGCHLHMEIHITEPGGSLVWNTNDDGGYRTAVNPRPFLDEYSA